MLGNLEVALILKSVRPFAVLKLFNEAANVAERGP